LQCVFGDGGCVFVMRREGVPVSYEEVAVIFFLELEPIGQGTKEMAEMEAACGAHAAEHSFLFGQD
jgi:hypothetical protein